MSEPQKHTEAEAPSKSGARWEEVTFILPELLGCGLGGGTKEEYARLIAIWAGRLSGTVYLIKEGKEEENGRASA